MDPFVADAQQLAENFDPLGDKRATESRLRILELTSDTNAPRSRKQFEPGHLTGSAIVLSPDLSSCVLLHHGKLHCWLQPGGHVDPTDASILETARRETIEETGLPLSPDFDPRLIHLDVHEIPPHGDEPYHLHHDLVFLFRADSLDLQLSEESHEIVWCPLDRPDPYLPDRPLRRSMERSLAFVRSL